MKTRKTKNLSKKITSAILAAALVCSPLQAISVAAEQPEDIQAYAAAQESAAEDGTAAQESAAEDSIAVQESAAEDGTATQESAAEDGTAAQELAIGEDAAAQVFAAGEDAGSTVEDAAELPFNQEKIWTLHSGDDVDYICFTATESLDTFYMFTISNIGADTIEFAISKSPYFTQDDVLGSGNWLEQGHGKTLNLAKLDPGHTYYIRVKKSFGYDNDTSYRLKIATIEDDVKDTADEAEELPLNQEVEKGLQNGEDVDVFRFMVTNSPDTFYTFTFKNIGVDTTEFAISKSPYFTQDDVLGGGNWLEQGHGKTLNLAKLDPGHTYYIRVKKSFGYDNETSYRLKVAAIEDDVKDTAREAKALSLNKPLPAALQNENDVDVFSFQTPDTDSFYEFKIANASNNNIVYAIYDNMDLTGEAVLSGNLDGGRDNLKDLYKLKRNKTYFIRINKAGWGEYTEPIPYTITVNSRLDDTNNRINNGDDKPANSTAIKAGATVKKGLQNIKDEDYYKFTVSGNENFYKLKLTNYGKANVFCKVWKKEIVGDPIREGVAEGKGAPTINLGRLEKGTYCICISRDTYNEFQATEQYALKLTAKKDDVKQVKYDKMSTADMSTAAKLKLGSTKEYAIDNFEDEDYFQFQTGGFKNYRLDFSNASPKGSISITIYKTKRDVKNGIVLDTYWCSGKDSVADGKEILKLKQNTKYYIKVSGNGATEAKYRLGVIAAPPTAKKIKKVNAQKVKLSWSKVDKATGYVIYRCKTKNGKYKAIKTINKNSTLTYIDKVKKGTYYYKIKAYRKTKKETEYSAFSNMQKQKI